MPAITFCGWLNEGNGENIYSLDINSCYRETILDALFPLLFAILSCILLSRLKRRRIQHNFTRIPIPKSTFIFQRTCMLLIFTLLEISGWAFVFAWRLESFILERSKNPSLQFNSSNNKTPLFYQVVDPGLAFIPRIYVLTLIIKSFTVPVNPADPSRFTKYKCHFLIFYSLLLTSAIARVLDYYYTDNKWIISPAIEKSFSLYDLTLSIILWTVIIISPSELDPRELLDLHDDDDSVLILHDGKIIRNGHILSLESTASLFSSLTFGWINALLKSAFHARLTASSLWALPRRQRARENFQNFASTNRFQQRITASSLVRRIYNANHKIILYQFVTSIAAVLFHYANPFFLEKLLSYIQEHRDSDPEVAYMYCIALFCCNVTSTLVASQTLLWGRRWHVNIVHMLDSEIYAHALKLKQAQETSDDQNSSSDLEETEEHEHPQASLMSQDTERLAELAAYLHIFYTCPLEITVGVVFLYKLLGNAFFAGLMVMFIALPSTHFLSRRVMVAQSNLADAKSWRLRLLHELFKGMKTIKFLAYERRWEQAITNAREDELVKLVKLYTQNTILGLVWFSMSVFVTTVSFTWYTLVEKKTLDASTAFVSLILFGMLRDPLNVIPQILMAHGDAKISLNHIATFLNTPVKEPVTPPQPLGYEDQVKVGFESTVSTFEWAFGDSFKLTVPFIQFPAGVISMVTGPPQSGKSSLLAALMGEMPMTHGENTPVLPSRYLPLFPDFVRDPRNTWLYLHKVAYVSQKPWTEHGTVRENILFSESWDDSRYRSVLHQCDLLRDLSLFENGDLTSTTNMSDLIKLKISLARAVYSRSKTVIIDGIFSALDKTTSLFIFENCIHGDSMKGRTVIIADADVFWARDAHLLISMVSPTDGSIGGIQDMETDPEKIMHLARKSNEKAKYNQLEDFDKDVTDVIDVLFEQMDSSIIQNNSSTLFEEDIFDEASIIPESIRQEDQETRNYSRDLAYATYYSACGSWKYWSAVILFTLIARLANISENYWLKEGKLILFCSVWSMAFSRYSSINVESDNNYVLIYMSLCLATVICNLFRTIIQHRGSLGASSRLFSGLLRSVCHAPLQFFEATPVPQIMSRFNKDMETIDSNIGWQVNFLLQTVFGVFGVVLTIGAILPEFFGVSLIAAVLYLYIGVIYIRASRELKKLNSESRSPIFHLYTDTLAGLFTIRAYKEERNMMKKMFNRLDDNMRPFYTLWNTNRWLFVRVELLGAFLSLFISISMVRKIKTIDAGLAGIALMFSTNLLEYVYWLMRQFTTVDMHFEAIERVAEYMEMPQEPPGIVDGSRPPAAWPTYAAIQVRDLMVSFSSSEVDAILKHISFSISPGEKVAIVGREGVEKAALVSCLFRFMEPIRGTVKIDGINIAWIGVEDLRSRITFISKEGWLLTGTVRSNLDPFGEYDDYSLWQVLYRVQLAKPFASNEYATGSSHKYEPDVSVIQDLDKDLGKDGHRLSVFERQLLCIARALLQDCTKLVLFEEAKLCSEEQTVIESVIRREFDDSTLIVIPNTLHTLMNYDKVMVFDQGNLVEFDSAIELLNKQQGFLLSLCEKAGILNSLLLDKNVFS